VRVLVEVFRHWSERFRCDPDIWPMVRSHDGVLQWIRGGSFHFVCSDKSLRGRE
jgi:hypothetical protein